MPKFMNTENRYYSKMNLQLFAEDDGDAGADDAGDGDDQDDGQDNPDADEDGDDEPKYTQADLDKAVARTIAKERAKAERKAKKDKGKKDGTLSDDENEDVKARKEAEGKASRLEVKVACFEADVAKDAVDDVAALAHAYMEADESLDLEDAIEKVVKKYPQFKKGGADPYEEDQNKGKSWGERQRGSGKKVSGVEAAFLKKNPGLKID